MKRVLLWSLFILSLMAQPSFSQSHKLKAGEKAPKFYLRTLNGDNFFLSDYCGQLRKPWIDTTRYVLVLDFFATWCQPCIKEIPEIERAAQKYKNNKVKFFLIDFKEDEMTVKKFLQKRKINLPILIDTYGVAAEKYGVKSLPHLFIIDKSGKIRLAKNGYSSEIRTVLLQTIERHLK